MLSLVGYIKDERRKRENWLEIWKSLSSSFPSPRLQAKKVEPLRDSGEFGVVGANWPRLDIAPIINLALTSFGAIAPPGRKAIPTSRNKRKQKLGLLGAKWQKCAIPSSEAPLSCTQSLFSDITIRAFPGCVCLEGARRVFRMWYRLHCKFDCCTTATLLYLSRRSRAKAKKGRGWRRDPFCRIFAGEGFGRSGYMLGKKRKGEWGSCSQ